MLPFHVARQTCERTRTATQTKPRFTTATGAYVYYSYEQFGRGYIGARNRDPVGDVYFGTFSDPTFNPTEKVVIAEFETFEEALAAEVELHNYFEVDVNPHFANRARQTSSGFQFDPTGREKTEEERKKLKASWTPERREAQAARMADHNRSEGHRQRMRGDDNPGKGEKSRQIVTERNKAGRGKKAHPNTARALREAASRPKSAATREKMRQAALNRKKQGGVKS